MSELLFLSLNFSSIAVAIRAAERPICQEAQEPAIAAVTVAAE